MIHGLEVVYSNSYDLLDFEFEAFIMCMHHCMYEQSLLLIIIIKINMQIRGNLQS